MHHGGNDMDFLDNSSLELLKDFFTDAMRADVLRAAAFALLWRELSGIRKGLEAVIGRVDNHETRLGKLEDHDAAGTAD